MKIKPAFEIEWNRSGMKAFGKSGLTPFRWAWGFINHNRYPKAGNLTMTPLLIWNPNVRKLS